MTVVEEASAALAACLACSCCGLSSCDALGPSASKRLTHFELSLKTHCLAQPLKSQLRAKISLAVEPQISQIPDVAPY
jgi:hypothetical protein